MEYYSSNEALTEATKWHTVLIIACFFAIGFLVYGHSLGNDFVHFDDDILVFENPAIQEMSPASIQWIFTHYDPELYVPLTFISYQIDHMIGGLQPMMFHLTNLVLHIVNALLVAYLLFIFLGRGHSRIPAAENNYRTRGMIAVMCGLLFLLHPLHTETVAWVSARKDLLSAMFFLVSIIAYVKNRKTVSLTTFVIGMMAKVSIVVLPIILLLIDWKNGQRLRGKVITEKIPFFVVAIVFGIVAIFGKSQILADSPIITSILVACKSSIFYLQKLLIPIHLSVVYPFHDVVTITDPFFMLPLLLVSFGFIWILFSLGRTKVLAFGLAFYFLTLAPSFTNYAKDDLIFFASDRYAYLPSIGILFLLAMLLIRINRQKIVAMVMTIVIVLFGFLTYKQSLVWRNTATLFTHAAQFYDYYKGYNKIGAELWNEGNYNEALQQLNHSIELRPNARAYYNLGLVYLAKDDHDQAAEKFLKALSLNPNHLDTHLNLGFLYWNAGDTDDAIYHMEQAAELDAQDVEVLTNLAVMYKTVGRTEDARTITQTILTLDPKNTDAMKLMQSL